MSYEAWSRSVPRAITDDVLWRAQASRLALYRSDLSWQDVTLLLRVKRTIALADQLYRAVGSVGANIAEGYSRGTGRDRARFFEYALGSAREARDWYYKGRFVLAEETVAGRIDLLAKSIRLLLVMIPNRRSQAVSEEQALYAPGE